MTPHSPGECLRLLWGAQWDQHHGQREWIKTTCIWFWLFSPPFGSTFAATLALHSATTCRLRCNIEAIFLLFLSRSSRQKNRIVANVITVQSCKLLCVSIINLCAPFWHLRSLYIHRCLYSKIDFLNCILCYHYQCHPSIVLTEELF